MGKKIKMVLALPETFSESILNVTIFWKLNCEAKRLVLMLSTFNTKQICVWKYLTLFGPSGVCALPLAAGTNEGGHYFHYIFYGI